MFRGILFFALNYKIHSMAVKNFLMPPGTVKASTGYNFYTICRLGHVHVGMGSPSLKIVTLKFRVNWLSCCFLFDSVNDTFRSPRLCTI